MSLVDYFSDISRELKRKSDQVRVHFKTHRPSLGDNRETIVAKFLQEHLPKAFDVSTGLILSKSGLFSHQADIVIVDQLNNAPLYSSLPEKIWLVEAVFSLIEVKTYLNPQNIADSIKKCRRFKTLSREFGTVSEIPRIRDSIFTIWAFESPNPETVKENYRKAIKELPRAEQPDFVIVPDKMVIMSGEYYALTKLGQNGSPYRKQLEKKIDNIEKRLGDGFEVWYLEEHALMTWFVCLNSWLVSSGPRIAPLLSYLPNKVFGKIL